MSSCGHFKKGHQLSKTWVFLEIPHLGKGTALFQCFSTKIHFSGVTAGTNLFLVLSIQLFPKYESYASFFSGTIMRWLREAQLVYAKF